MVTDFPIMATAVAAGTIGTYLFGDSFWAVLFLCYFAIFVDTFMKWTVIVKQFYFDKGIPDPTTWQKLKAMFFGDAWMPGYLESKYFGRIIEKIVSYTLILPICYGAGKWIPAFEFFGASISPGKVFPAVISIAILLYELSSINESLMQMGHKSLSEMISRFINLIMDKLLPKRSDKNG